ncbi:hypothetical protein AMECASPLE_014162 [Ameca splendens]|uniref:Uncharacterized protein n=1 Tax=Ameca splendens TaxID=208324 RepID=A0ABV0YZI5_9TELE
MFISVHSILGWGSFYMNCCISAASHGGNQHVVLLRCLEVQVALIAVFRSSALLVLESFIFLLTILHRFPMRFWSAQSAGQSSTVIGPALGGQCGSVPSPAGKCISIKLVSRRKHKVF